MVTRLTRLVAVALVAGGCQGSLVRSDSTGIELTVRFDGEAGIDQLALAGFDDGGDDAFVPGRLPETPVPLTSGEVTGTLLVDEALDGREIVVRVDGLAAGAIV